MALVTSPGTGEIPVGEISLCVVSVGCLSIFTSHPIVLVGATVLVDPGHEDDDGDDDDDEDGDGKDEDDDDDDDSVDTIV